jgi:hypothetical protein
MVGVAGTDPVLVMVQVKLLSWEEYSICPS